MRHLKSWQETGGQFSDHEMEGLSPLSSHNAPWSHPHLSPASQEQASVISSALSALDVHPSLSLSLSDHCIDFAAFQRAPDCSDNKFFLESFHCQTAQTDTIRVALRALCHLTYFYFSDSDLLWGYGKFIFYLQKLVHLNHR